MRRSDAKALSNLTSPCKGEVGGEAAGRGSPSRFARTEGMTDRARRLRNTMTDAETKLWRALRRNQINDLSFRRQHPVDQHVLDFYCPAILLAIEVDGGQHNLSKQQSKDAQRTIELNERGIVVLRYWNNDVLTNLSGVLEDIVRVVEEWLRASPPPERGRSADEGRRVGVQSTAPAARATPPRRAPRADPPLPGEGERRPGDSALSPRHGKA